MSVEYTQSVASGYLTDIIYYNEGSLNIMEGHYCSPSNATGIIETGMFNVVFAQVQDADPTTYAYSANSNGTYAVLFSGMVAGATGFFQIKGY